MERKDYIEHLKRKGYEILSDDQVSLNGVKYTIGTDLLKCNGRTQQTFFLKRCLKTFTKGDLGYVYIKLNQREKM